MSKEAPILTTEGKMTTDQQIKVILSDYVEGNPNDGPAGLLKDNPALEELDGSVYGMYWCFNVFCILMPPMCIFTACMGCLVIQPMTAVIIVVFEKVLETKMTPGLNWYWPCLTTNTVISLRMESLRVTNEQGGAFQVPDSTGSPMNVNTMVNYVIDDPVKAVYATEDLH